MDKPKSFKPKKVKGAKKFVSKASKDRHNMYDVDWKKYRWRFLHHNPKCYCCSAKSNAIDHITSHKGDAELFKDTLNFMPLCDSCHNTVTRKFDMGDIPKTEEKVAWINENRKRLGVTTKIKVVRDYVKGKY